VIPSDASTTPTAKPAKSGYRRDLPHLQFEGRTLYITFATKDRWSLPPEARTLVLRHLLHDHESVYRLHVAVVMPDHVHTILTPMRDETGEYFGTAQIMHRVKGAAAHSINRSLHRSGAVWQSEYFDRMLRGEDDLRTAVEYVCTNPVEAALCASDDEYPWLWRSWVDDQV
jgi:REP element-mobilizing transposase RayT